MKDKIKQYLSKNIIKEFKEDFGIRFKDSLNELKFAEEFLEDAIKDAYFKGLVKGLFYKCPKKSDNLKDPTEDHLLKVLKKAKKIKDIKSTQKSVVERDKDELRRSWVGTKPVHH